MMLKEIADRLRKLLDKNEPLLLTREQACHIINLYSIDDADFRNAKVNKNTDPVERFPNGYPG